MKINICVSVNSKYARYLYVMLTSLFMSNSDECIRVYVLQRDLTREDKEMLSELTDRYGQKICFIDIDATRFTHFPTSLKFSVESYFRLLMPELLPEEVSRVLYMDVDIIVAASVRELYLTDLEGNLFAACEDIVLGGLNANRRKLFNRYDDLRYFNAGVMIWDLEAVRKDFSFQDFMRAAKELNYELPFVDQDLLNYMMYDKVKYLDPYQYNYLVERDRYENRVHQPVILHYAGCNPWQIGIKSGVYKVWWEYSKLTPFYTEFLEEQLERVERAVNESGFKEQSLVEMREIYRLLYELKGTGRISKSMDESECDFALYGAGFLGEYFWVFLECEGVKRMPVCVVDRERTDDFHGLEIRKNFDWADSIRNCQLVVTPSYRTNTLVGQLQAQVPDHVQVISLKRFLENIN